MLALALAVAGPNERAHRYKPDGSNALEGWSSIASAADDRVPFVVSLAEDLLGLDLDTAEEVSLLQGILALLKGRALVPVVVSSGQEGRRHIFARVPTHLRAEVEDHVVRLVGSRRVLRTTIRPPLSPHRLGLPVALLEPSTVAGALQALGRSSQRSGRLSGRMWLLLRDGDTKGRYPTSSEVEMALVLEMVNVGWSVDRVIATLLDTKYPGGSRSQERLRSRGRASVEAAIRRDYSKARAKALASPAWSSRQEVIVELVRFRDRVDEYPWRGSRGQTLKVVMSAVLQVAIDRGSLTVLPSHRLLAERTGLDRHTIRAALVELLEEHWLRTQRTDRGKAQALTINLNRRRSIVGPPSTSPLGGCEVSGPRLDPRHDAFAYGAGLGKTGHALLIALVEPLTVKDLVDRTSVPKTTVAKLLKTMLASGLVTKVDVTYETDVRLLPLRLGVHAREHHTHLTALQRRARHQRERLERQGTSAAQNPPHDGPVGAQEGRARSGLLDPTSGAFQPLGEPLSGKAVIGATTLHGLTVSFRHRGHGFTFASPGSDSVMQEVVPVSHYDSATRSFTQVAPQSSLRLANSQGETDPDPYEITVEVLDDDGPSETSRKQAR